MTGDRRAKERALALASVRYKRGEEMRGDPEQAYGPPLPDYRPQEKHLFVERRLREGRRHNLLVGGSRSGKTFHLVKHVMRRALLADDSRHGIFRLRGNAIQASIRLDTLPKVARVCYPRLRLQYKERDGFVLLPNDSQIWLGGLDEKERIEKVLGQEFATIYLNEASQIRYSSVNVIRTRLAQVARTNTGKILAQQELMDLNPVGKSHYSYREFVEGIDPETRKPILDWDKDYFYAFVQPHDNAPNLDPRYLADLAKAPPRYRKRFLEGQYVADVDGALWTLEALEQARAVDTEIPSTLDRVVVALDPSGTSGRDSRRENISDDIGMIVAGRAGLGPDAVGWLLEDATCNEPPREWGRRAVALFRKWHADKIVAEANFGGAMVREVIDAAARQMGVVLPPVELVTASRGKSVRAEPVSVLTGYERDGEWEGCRVRHAGEFTELEEELLNFSVYGYLGPNSPNSADAYVWAMTDLMLGEPAPSLWSEGDLQLVE